MEVERSGGCCVWRGDGRCVPNQLKGAQMSRFQIFGAALLGGAMAIAMTPANAAVSVSKSDHSQITVLAPRIVSRPASDGLGQVRTITASSIVNYDDLNLHLLSGRNKLKDRVKDAAQMLCNKLDSVYPLSASTDEDYNCIHGAVRGAQPQIEAAFANDPSKLKLGIEMPPIG
jgi:UrcA family protein